MDYNNVFILWLYVWGVAVSFLFFENEVDDRVPYWRIWLCALTWFTLVPLAVLVASYSWLGDRWVRWRRS